ncbi:predicted protein [Scheffersomyces stipitis CBS 6054]|uniref:Uncharacterized protein n=1 Tax=Scheffersomyces stipitis (strain ATCC 58785 / CBS 6054 / NBRC 10063 / NRRL Y-11545) TaxID=322104 RepID=A3LXP0_PICST|nr:predicted protein [Scheffersomyces stipitis CBS 6054]ABN67498.2 predicted protein [Scheffersomyces stipitis CBS 6054]KAG2732241.1 hypothetical protein G9P44_004658 [Scheffersomyces stipitis]
MSRESSSIAKADHEISENSIDQAVKDESYKPEVVDSQPQPNIADVAPPLAEAFAISTHFKHATTLRTGNPISYAYNNYDHYHHKIHKFIKRTFHRLYYPNEEATPGGVTSPTKSIGSTSMLPKEQSSSNSSSYIFERSLESNASRTILNNPETPSHYLLENYTNPILDTTTEIISNPNLDFYNDVKLNCYCEDDCAEDHVGEPRPRSRSIISSSLISSFDHHNNSSKSKILSDEDGEVQEEEEGEEDEEDEEYNDDDSKSRHSHHQSKSKRSSFSAPSIASSRTASGAVSPLTKRSISFVKTSLPAPMTPAGNPNASRTGSNGQTIDFYSFADMINNEDFEEGEIAANKVSETNSQFRKGSFTTMSVKDYIGVL